MLAGCVAYAGSQAAAETLDEQPIAAPEQAAPALEQAAPDSAATESADRLVVRDVRVEATDTGRRLVMALSREPEGVSNFQLSSPPRMVVDLHGPIAGKTKEARFAVADDGVTRVRVAPYDGQLRVVLDLKRRGVVTGIRQEGSMLVADLEPLPAAPVRLAKATPAAKAAAPIAEPELAAALVAGASEPAPTPIETEPAPTPTPTPAVIEAPEVPRAKVAPPRRASRVREKFEDIGDQGPTMERIAAVDPYEARLAPARVPGSIMPAPGSPAYNGQKISLDFKDADIQTVLRVLADVSGLNIIATDDVQGKVTLHLNEVPWDQAFELVLRTNRLEKTQEGNVVRVSVGEAVDRGT
jgi:hypothetical protein